MKINKKIKLSKSNIRKILDVMDKFPDSTQCIICEKGCEIGSIVELELPSVCVNDVEGTFVVEIEGVENW